MQACMHTCKQTNEGGFSLTEKAVATTCLLHGQQYDVGPTPWLSTTTHWWPHWTSKLLFRVAIHFTYLLHENSVTCYILKFDALCFVLPAVGQCVLIFLNEYFYNAL